MRGYLYINQPLSDTFNLYAKDLIGKTIDDWMPGAAASYKEHDREVLACGGTLQFDHMITTPEGAIRHWLSFKFPHGIRDGRRLIGAVELKAIFLQVRVTARSFFARRRTGRISLSSTLKHQLHLIVATQTIFR